MALLSPWPDSEESRKELIASLRELIGCSVIEVRYLEPSTADRTTASHARGFDEVGMGVELDLSNEKTWVAAWEMKGYCEGLAFGIAPTNDYVRSDRVKPILVSNTDDWRTRLGRPIESVGLAWHLPDERCVETVWSLRLGVRDADVVIALGEKEEPGCIGYQPDNLVVVFDPIVANSYETPASDQTAWGSDA